MKNRDEFLPLIVDAIARYSGTALRMRRLSEYGRSVSVVYRRLRISAEKIDQAILLIALLAVLLDHETVKATGAWLIGWIVAAGCSELSCWKYSTTVTGLAAIISAYIALRMAVEVSSDDADCQGTRKRARGSVQYLHFWLE
jgi:hypothetical protein